jgi:hypothetical protein
MNTQRLKYVSGDLTTALLTSLIEIHLTSNYLSAKLGGMLTKASLQAYRDQLLRQMDLVDSLIENFYKLAGAADSDLLSTAVTSLRAVPSAPQQMFTVPTATRQPRVRGVLAAVREIVEEMPGSFDKNDIMAKLKERDPDLAANTSAANLRNTLRILAKSGDITVQVNATSTTCAQYVSKRAAA